VLGPKSADMHLA